MRLDPLDKIREDDGDAMTTADDDDGGGVMGPPPVRLETAEEEETVYGRCSKRERPSMRKSEKQDSIM